MLGEPCCESLICECESLKEINANLRTALTTSRRIGAAIGIVMSRRGITYDEGFELLRYASQHLHRKLRDIADEVLYIGRLPEFPGDIALTAVLDGNRREPDPPAGEASASATSC